MLIEQSEERRSPEEIALDNLEGEEKLAEEGDPLNETRKNLNFVVPEDAKIQEDVPHGKLLFDGQNCYMLVKLNGTNSI